MSPDNTVSSSFATSKATPDYAQDIEKAPESALETVETYPVENGTTRALVWKQDLRIVPLCAGIYLLCYLDRSNIGKFFQ